MWNRRAFLCGAIGPICAALAVPCAAEAQQAGKRHRIGYLATFPPTRENPVWHAFMQGLRDHGYVGNQNFQIEGRFSEGEAERLPGLAADLVRSGVALIVASAPAPSRAARDATATIPIVFVGVADPVGLGLVAHLGRRGGNVTGLTSIEWEQFTAKQLEVIKEALPQTSRVAILINPTNRVHTLTLPQEQAAAERLKVVLQLVEARDGSELERAFTAVIRDGADVLHVWGDPLTFKYRVRIFELAMQHRLPTMHFYRDAVVAGGLLSYGPHWPHIWRNAGKYVDRIFKGEKPAEIPVEQPTRYELVINLKTAKALGLTIPPSLLLRADQVIE